MSPARSPLLEGCLLACIVAAGAVLRWGAMTPHLGYDECQHFLVASNALAPGFLEDYRPRAHPPGSYLIIAPFLELGTSPVIVRLASLLSGLAAIAVCHRILRRLTPSFWAPLLGALGVACLPPFVDLAAEARGYSFALLAVWLSFAAFLRIQRSGGENVRDWLLLALAQLVAVMTVYSALFHLLALFALALAVYAPAHRRGGLRPLVLRAAPQLGVLALFAASFVWQMGGRVPVYGHVEPYVYGGGLLDAGAVATFFGQRFGGFLAGLLPLPQSLAVPPLVVAGLVWPAAGPLFASPRRALASYAVLAVFLLFAAALLGKFPFGGIPRHGVAVAPGIFLACFCCVDEAVRRGLRAGWPRVAVAAAIVAALVPGFARGLAPHRAEPSATRGFPIEERREQLLESPRPLVVNGRARSFLSWWWFRDRRPHLVDADAKARTFDYGGIRVVEASGHRRFARSVRDCALAHGACWVALAFLSEAGAQEMLQVLADAAEADGGLQLDPIDRGPLGGLTFVLLEARAAR